MIYIKSPEEIKIIREGGRRLAAILARLKKEVKPGAHTADIENLAIGLIKTAGGEPAFKNYPMPGGLLFPSAVCVSINDEVVHGGALPDRVIENGDIVDLDIGMEWPTDLKIRAKWNAPVNQYSKNGGFFTDTCATVGAGQISEDAKKLLQVTEEALYAAIKQVKPGHKLNDLARAVETMAHQAGYGVVKDLVGHGVGYFAHEDPEVFNFMIKESAPENMELEAGLVIAIEPMINEGDWPIKIAKNGYTILTADGSLSAHFEHTVAVTEKGVEILTK